jgi:hypothetical protein
MKINIELDMAPEEARRLMGLPDVAPLQVELLDTMRKRMQAAMDSYEPQALLKAWMPLGGQGLEQFQKFLWDSAARAMASGNKKDKP